MIDHHSLRKEKTHLKRRLFCRPSVYRIIVNDGDNDLKTLACENHTAEGLRSPRLRLYSRYKI